MTKVEIGALVEKLIWIRDNRDLTREDRDTLADACNLIYHHEDELAEK